LTLSTATATITATITITVTTATTSASAIFTTTPVQELVQRADRVVQGSVDDASETKTTTTTLGR
jgi:hypothetical protein